MMPHELAGRTALVYGVERPAGRKAAVALAEAGADVALVTLTEDTAAEFAANSTANEFWALDRKSIVLTTDGRETTFREAIADATTELAPISILVYHSDTPMPREAIAGLRSDPAIVVIVDGSDIDASRALLEWTRTLADAGLRANALVTSRAAADAIGPTLKEHHPPHSLDIKSAVVYLASDATAAVEGAMLIAAD
jgi:NAD(P)-dependent dehydrogenase (short-subunit alcohol dehydrogenase family)